MDLENLQKNNKEDVEIFNYRQSYIRLKDGTEIFGLYKNRKDSIRCQRYD